MPRPVNENWAVGLVRATWWGEWDPPCRGRSALFFSSVPARQDEAAVICRDQCPDDLRLRCALHAEPWGTWGGITEFERGARRRPRRKVASA